MGITPYMSPDEYLAFKLRVAHEKKFLMDHGYNHIYNYDKNGKLVQQGFLAPNGVYYKTSEEMYKGYGQYPVLKKDGVCYGFYEVLQKHKYIDPYKDEMAFIESEGYDRIQSTLEYMKANEYLEKYFKEKGFVPRWQKDGKHYGHIELLRELRYRYPFRPAT